MTTDQAECRYCGERVTFTAGPFVAGQPFDPREQHWVHECTGASYCADRAISARPCPLTYEPMPLDTP